VSSGRGSLVSQCIKYLLDHPGIAHGVDEAKRAALSVVKVPGVAFLVELLDGLIEAPATSTAQVEERYRERPEYRRIRELAAAESLAQDAKSASKELADAIDRLIDEAARARADELLEKSRQSALADAEKDELRRLMARRVGDPYGSD
jgi:hypothetical protein